MRTLRKCKWSDIEVGEVFAINGCWIIAYKKSQRICVPLAEDHYGNEYPNGAKDIGFNWSWLLYEEDDNFLIESLNLYKLSLSDQRKWRTD